jgi:hypothetical protein
VVAETASAVGLGDTVAVDMVVVPGDVVPGVVDTQVGFADTACNYHNTIDHSVEYTLIDFRILDMYSYIHLERSP